MTRKSRMLPGLMGAAVLTVGGAAPTASAVDPSATHGGFVYEQPSYEPSRRWNSWYGPSRPYPGQDAGNWAVGTFYGRNSGNGNDETITIRADGSAELRTRDAPPKYGSFAGETLTFDTRMSRVQPARGGIVIDGSFYRR